VVIVANLAPRKLRGMESNGMIVAASLEGGKASAGSFFGGCAGGSEAEMKRSLAVCGWSLADPTCQAKL
jgi:tRNA-binding EMAP/Myf-like protein